MAGILHHDHGHNYLEYSHNHSEPIHNHSKYSHSFSAKKLPENDLESPVIDVVEASSQLSSPVPEEAPLTQHSWFQQNSPNIAESLEVSQNQLYKSESRVLNFLSGGGPHSYTNINVRSAFLHVIGDLIQSIGVVVASIIIYINPELTFVDPLCTFLFSIIVLWTTFRLFGEAIHVLMEGTPLSIDPSVIQKDLLSIENVIHVYDLHVWSISSNKMTMTAHINYQISNNSACESHSIPSSVLLAAKNIVLNKYGIQHCTIQVEEVK